MVRIDTGDKLEFSHIVSVFNSCDTIFTFECTNGVQWHFFTYNVQTEIYRDNWFIIDGIPYNPEKYETREDYINRISVHIENSRNKEAIESLP